MVILKALTTSFSLSVVNRIKHVQNKQLTLDIICLSLIFLLLGIKEPVSAQDLGVQGTLYPIQEQNALSWIQERLIELQASGALSRAQEILKTKALSALERPSPVRGLKPTDTPRTFEKDLTITLQTDIQDVHGKVIYKAGTKLNPLMTQACSKTLVFLDADCPQQWDWALKQYQAKPEQTKLVLVNGPVLALMRTFQIPLYFDQAGRLVDYFQIQQVPALVFQSQDKLKIREVKL